MDEDGRGEIVHAEFPLEAATILNLQFETESRARVFRYHHEVSHSNAQRVVRVLRACYEIVHRRHAMEIEDERFDDRVGLAFNDTVLVGDVPVEEGLIADAIEDRDLATLGNVLIHR